MNRLFFSLAAIDFEDMTAPWRGNTGSARPYFIVLGAVALVSVALLVWAAFFRNRRRHHSHHHHHHHHDASAESLTPGTDGAPASDSPEPRRRRRRRRREHRPRNPTLAETGGLPPIRPDKPPEHLP